MNSDGEVWIQIKTDRVIKDRLKKLARVHERDMSKHLRFMVNRDYEAMFGQATEQDHEQPAQVEQK